jgi:hypothetical protein
VRRRRLAALPETLDFAAGHFAAALRSGTAAEGLAAMAGKRPASWVAPTAAVDADAAAATAATTAATANADADVSKTPRDGTPP